MGRNIQKHGLINLLALLLVGVSGFAASQLSNSLAGLVSLVFIGIGVLVAGVSWFQMRLEENERLERLELESLAKGHAEASLFEGRDAEVFPARRSREQFERLFVPGFTIVLFLAQAAALFFLWRWLRLSTTALSTVSQPMVAIALFSIFALVLFLLGKFSSTIARLENQRLLRPGASYLLLGAYLCFLVALGVSGVEAGFPRVDYYLAHALVIVLGLVAVETLINLVLEMYRPRLKGKVGRPLYESRLVGLLGQPEGLITTAAQALDYQFGFKVSETWFYRFFEKALVWLILMQFGLLLFSTTLVFIEAGEQGLLERFGKPVADRTVLEAGPHLKFPWPIDRVYRFRTEQIQSFEIGTAPDALQEEGRLVLWTVAHNKEDNFLVANREPKSAEGTNAPASKRTPPVSLLTGTLPVQFQITNLMAWAYNNEDSPSLLEDLARREIVRFLVGADMNEIMSFGRMEASQNLVTRIQAAADRHQLGAKVISVGLEDLHPPVKVAPDYEKVVAATHTKQARILAARADDIRTNALAGAQARSLTNQASAEAIGRQITAASRAALFTNQIPAFAAAPAVYTERAYLQAFVRATATARKYVLLATNTHDVITFDLQDKIRDDMLNVTVPPPKK
jgi:membrane protease subunit HflK